MTAAPITTEETAMTGTAITKYDEQLAQAGQQYVADLPPTGRFISIKGGIMSFEDNPLPANQAAVIIVDSIRENVFYPDEYDPDAPSAPRCFAFGRGKEEMIPHISMAAALDWFSPQAETCKVCPNNVFGSAEKGHGKACQNRFRLALLPAGVYSERKNSRDLDLEFFSDPAHYETADLAYLKLPVTSGKNWSEFVKQVSGLYNRPPYGVVTRLYLQPDPKSQYKVNFEVLDLVPETLLPTIFRRNEEAQQTIAQPYSPPEA
jgi:hypothetical protein